MHYLGLDAGAPSGTLRISFVYQLRKNSNAFATLYLNVCSLKKFVYM